MRSLVIRLFILLGLLFSALAAAVTPMAGRKTTRSPDGMQWNPGKFMPDSGLLGNRVRGCAATLKLRLLLAMLACLLTAPAWAAFTDNGDGTVSDTATGLMWQRCAKGQTWTGSTCSGSPTGYTWDAAVALTDSFAGHTDWRLPVIAELQSLVKLGSVLTIDTTAFPNTPASFFWSGSSHDPSGAWIVYFNGGATGAYIKAYNAYVRLVRGGQSFGSLAVCTLTASPASISAGGSSTLTASCSPAASSYSWTGGTCVGKTTNTCTTTSSATTTYSVAGINSGGTGAAASATVTVTSSALAAAQVASFAGTYSGTFSGGDSGTWTATILSTGSITATLASNNAGTLIASGQVSPNGSLTMTSGSVSSGATFTGTINSATGTISGTWTNTYYGISGTWIGTVINASPTLNTLSVTRSGTGTGTITSNTGGIDCGTSCWADYTSGTSVALTATPASGSNFTGWSGDCSGTGSCVVTMSEAKNVTATFNPVPFTVTVTGVTDGIITAPVATVTATINVNTADVGRAGAVYITAWIPASALGTVLPTGSASGTLTVKSAGGSVSSMTMAALANVDTSSYVLVQLTTSGWQAVVNGQLIPYTSGTLAEQSAALTILNNTDTASLPGAQICVGYGIGDTTSANAAEMIRNGNMQLIASVPDTNATSASMGSCILSANYTDSWYNANESGWGLTITDHDTNAFVQWYTYDQTGHNQKYVISGGTFSNGKCLFSGDIKRITGPSWTQPTFDSTQVTRTTVGTGSIDFCPAGLTAGTIVFDYTAEGVTGSKQLSRLSFGNDVPHWGGAANTGARDFSDLWWNSSESGWGVSVTQHGNNLFFRIFAYDTDNRPLLFIVPGVTFNSSTSFTGNLVLTSGPWYGTEPFDPTQVTRTTAGTATLTFSDADNGVLSYTVNGVTVTKTITRLVF